MSKKLYEKERDSVLYQIQEDNNFFESKREYHAKQIKSGDQLEVQVYELWPTGASRKGEKKKPTREEQQRLNRKHSALRCVRLINRNFTENDSWITLTYSEDNRPKDEVEAQKRIRSYIGSVKRRFPETELKYIYTTEYGSSWVHHHVVLNVSDRDKLEELWSPLSERSKKKKNPSYRIKKYGRTNARRLQPDDFGLTGMGVYISKEGSGANKKKFVCSKNLDKPVEIKTKTLKGKRLTNSFVKKLARDKEEAKQELLKLFPEYQFNDIQVLQTPYTKGYYLYRQLKYIDSGQKGDLYEKKSKQEPLSHKCDHNKTK